MSDMTEMNSVGYWEGRFASDWQDKAGPAQSRSFARLAFENLPPWFLGLLRREPLTLCDWGCAQGDGTDVLAAWSDPRRVTGVDFSGTAIEQAARRYPALRFLKQDWLSGDPKPGEVFDLVFSSNTLEHFHEPFRVLEVLVGHARKGLILVLPYRELERISEHFFTFHPDNVPLVLGNGFRLVWSRVADCRARPDAQWEGEQLILLYGDPGWLDPLGLSLADASIEQEDGRGELARLSSALKERDGQLAQVRLSLAKEEGRTTGLGEALAQREERLARLSQDMATLYARVADQERTIADLEAERLRATRAQAEAEGLIRVILGSRSWRLTKPLRFAARATRQGALMADDRRRILELAQRLYRGLPIPAAVRRGLSPWLAAAVRRSAELPSPPFLNLPVLTAPEEGEGQWLHRAEPQGRGGLDERALAAWTERLYRVLCFPVIDWEFRFQRPQQLMRQFAQAGHEVTYVSMALGPELVIRELEERVRELRLRGPGGLNPYRDTLSPELADQLADQLVSALALDSPCPLVCLVQLPFWSPLAAAIQGRTGCRVVYDCMDDHSGFSTNAPAMIEGERHLIEHADLTVFSSQVLMEKLGRDAPRALVIPNACDFAHFESVPLKLDHDRDHPCIGYFGAIADWFDSDLLAAVARARPGWRFELIGSTFSADLRPFEGLPNLALLGEQPYPALPKLIADWDCCIIPFRRGPLTDATDPVKVYEMLAAGKPVAAVPLPQLVPLAERGLIRTATTATELLAAVEDALGSDDLASVEARKAYAALNTWSARFAPLDAAIRALWPLASVIVTTFHNEALNRLCLDGVLTETSYPNLELVVVDNGSEDGTPDYLAELSRLDPRVRAIYNPENRGFAGGYNQGLAAARGDYLCLLNNDTVVTPWWLATLVTHLQRHPELGLVGPVTNAIDNEAKVPVGYDELDEMSRWAASYCSAHRGELFPIPMLAFFCVAMRRSVYARVGPLDERFVKGMWEDNDYCRRVREAGLDLRCARDAFVHHWQRASFDLLGEEEYQQTFVENRDAYRSKWRDVVPVQAEGADRELTAAEIAQRIRETEHPAVIFAPSIGWNVHLFQRPQHLAIALAALGHVVIFDVSNAPDPVEGFKEIAPRLFLYRGDPAVLRELPDLLLWTFSYNYGYRDYFYQSTPALYDWIDDLEVFPYHQAQLRSLHERALRESAVVACVARVLLAEAQLTRPDAIYLPNAVEYERFAEVDPGDPAVEDEGLAEFLSRPGPLCGYYGALASWFDYKLLEDVAGRNPSWRFLLIGPDYDGSIRRARLKHHSNIYWAGPKDYRSLPGFLARFDVAMIPFVINDITRATSPLKLYEYFAGGKPVICTPMPECMAYPEVRIVTDASSFSGALGEARARGQDPVFRERLRELGRQNSWRARAEETLARFAEARASGSGARDSSVAP